MSLEQEIKLQITTENKVNLSEVFWPNGYRVGNIETIRLISTYFDTPDFYLVKHNVGLRLRQSDDAWFQTVKASGTVKDGLHQRDEWEFELAAAEFDIEKLKQTPLKPMINDQEIWPNLMPIFTTDFIRQTIQLALSDNSKIELAYDRGEIRANDQTTSIHEIELELKAGSVKRLVQLAEQLSKILPIEYSNVSKAKQGYQMVR